MGDALSVFVAAREAGGRLALRAQGRDFTFAELAALTAQRLAALDREGAGPGPYPLVAAATPDTVVTLCALLERRVPALMIDPRLTRPEADAQLALAAGAGCVAHPDAAAILFTSGTTGHARGAVLTRTALLASAHASAANLGWQDDDRWHLCMPLARVGGLSIVTRCLAARRTVVLAAGFDAAAFPADVTAERITLASLVPTMLARVLDAHPGWTAPAHLRAILLGGASAPAALLARAGGRGLPIVITYGLTESCSQVVATPYAARSAPAADGAGAPLPGAQLRVVDGRIEVRGPMLMAGYLDGPPLARDAWFDTGDMGEIDARGRLTVHARRVDLIVTGGDNVYPAEVERVLEAYPGIDAAGVFGVPDETWGQKVVAALVAQPPPAPDALADWLGARLAPQKRPRAVCFVPRLPLTPGGKLDRRALPALARELLPLPRAQ